MTLALVSKSAFVSLMKPMTHVEVACQLVLKFLRITILDLLVGDDSLVGVILVADDKLLHGCGRPELPHAPEIRYYDVNIGLLRQVVRVDEQGSAGVGAGDTEIPLDRGATSAAAKEA